MKKAKDAIKRQLKEQWEQACGGYLTELLRMWELDAHYDYWIGDETGSVYDYGIAMLPGWQASRGAQIENYTAMHFWMQGISKAATEEIERIK